MADGGLLDFIKTPEGQGLLSTVFGGLAGAKQGAPLNSLGRAGMAGLMGYGQAQDRQQQMAEAAQTQQYRQAQIDEYKTRTAREQAQAQQLAAKQAVLGKLYQPASPGAAPLNMDSMLPPELRTGLPSVAGIAPRSAGIDSSMIPQAIQAGVTPDELAKMDGLRNLGLDEVARTVEGTGPDGRPVTYQKDKFGRDVGAGVPKWVADTQADLGGSVGFLDPFTHQPKASLPKTMTFADRNAAGNLSLSRARLNWDQQGGGEGGTSQSGFNKQYGKPSPGYRWKADGSQEFIPGGPADQKAQLQKSGEGTVGTVVATLRDKYDQLNESGGLVNSDNGALANMGAWVGSTGLGQTLGGAVGTNNQSARDTIAMTRPLLLQAIMKATGMSSKQMDSNAELKLYLATATDPTKGYQANKEALDRIETLYGGGVKEQPKPPKPDAQAVNIPSGAVNALKMNPSLRSAFDEKYGAGSADKVLGK